MKADAEGRRIEYRPLASLTGNPRNPKAHADDTISASISRFGYLEPIVVDGRTGFIISGHGRTEALRRAEAEAGEPPEGVRVAKTGEWLAPIVIGWDSKDDIEAAAALIALNRTTELGGWIDESLLDALDTLSELDGGLDGVGYTEDDIALLRAALEGDPEHPEYTRKVDIPQYEPTLPEPPEPWELLDTSRTLEHLHSIEAHPDLPAEVKAFLHAAAHRHTRFRYGRIAEYYAHATPEVQALMEESALVIIDPGDAIRHGYVRLSDRLTEILSGDREDDYGDADA